MKCMVCEAPTIFAYSLKGMEAAFCPCHLPREEVQKIVVTVNFGIL